MNLFLEIRVFERPALSKYFLKGIKKIDDEELRRKDRTHRWPRSYGECKKSLLHKPSKNIIQRKDTKVPL
jgi:hypothetical protein